MAVRRPIVWNPSLRIYEQLQQSDGLDIGDIALSVSVSYLTGPVTDSIIDLGGYDLSVVSNGNTLLKLVADDNQLQLGANLKQVDGSSYKHSFFKSITTSTNTPATFLYRKTTNYLSIVGRCYARNISTAQDNVFDINCLLVGDPTNNPIVSTSSDAIIPMIQQTNNISLTFGVVADIVTFNIIGHPSNVIKWGFDFNITEIGT